ncbi:MAG: hypothetical protein WCK86_22590 [Planctomycetia bacterium]
MLSIPEMDNREKEDRGTPDLIGRVDRLVRRLASFAHRLLDLIFRLLLLLRDSLVLCGPGGVFFDSSLVGWWAFALVIGHLKSP